MFFFANIRRESLQFGVVGPGEAGQVWRRWRGRGSSGNGEMGARWVWAAVKGVSDGPSHGGHVREGSGQGGEAVPLPPPCHCVLSRCCLLMA